MNLQPSGRAIHDIEPDAAPLVSESSAAARLGLSPHTLANWRVTNRTKLPYVKIGRAVRYRLVDLDRFVSSNLVGAA